VEKSWHGNFLGSGRRPRIEKAIGPREGSKWDGPTPYFGKLNPTPGGGKGLKGAIPAEWKRGEGATLLTREEKWRSRGSWVLFANQLKKLENSNRLWWGGIHNGKKKGLPTFYKRERGKKIRNKIFQSGGKFEKGRPGESLKGRGGKYSGRGTSNRMVCCTVQTWWKEEGKQKESRERGGQRAKTTHPSL